MSACGDYDKNPNWWNGLWCDVAMSLPGSIRNDPLTNPKAFPVANLSPIAPSTLDQLSSFGSWTSQQAVDLTGQNLSSALQTAINSLPDSNSPNEDTTKKFSFSLQEFLLLTGIVTLGVVIVGNKL